jgi:hypothetical protein
MSKEFTETNKKYFWYPIIMLVVGIVLGVFLPSPKSSKTKEYPIEVQCHWITYGYASYPIMDADSVKGDTIWKDGNKIVNKNIINVTFK